MRTLLLFLCPVLLTHAVALPSFKHGRRERRSMGRKNTGCELSYDVEDLFKNSALVFYAQCLPTSSFGDITRLVSKLSEFSSTCCLHGAGVDCFQDKSSLFLDRVCEDEVLQFNNQDVALCCGNTAHQRRICFETLRHSRAVQVAAIHSTETLQERCLSYLTAPTDFVESLVYDVSRRTRLFPPQTIAKIVRASLKRYATCCKETTFKTCFTTMETQTLQVITNIIKEANKICHEYKDTGRGKTRLWAIMFFASFHPKSLIGPALEFAATYEMSSSKCCHFSEWTSDCFLDESEVLLNLFCSMTSTAAHGDCCLEIGSDRTICLNRIAIQESKDIPQKIWIRTEKLCEISEEYNASFFVWFTFEYAKRHRQENLNSVLSAVLELKMVLKRCCDAEFTESCLSLSLPELSFSIISSGPL